MNAHFQGMNRARTRTISALLMLAGASVVHSQTPIDLTTFSVWYDIDSNGITEYPATDGFADPNWILTPTTANNPGNSVYTVIYNGSIELNGQRVSGFFQTGVDDDFVGFVIGYTVADDFTGDAEWLLIDWKGADQGFDFVDVPDALFPFHSVTDLDPESGTEYFAPAGLALKRVFGFPTADEIWGGVDDPAIENSDDPLLEGFPAGGAETLMRSAVIGDVGYDRLQANPPREYQFDLDVTPTTIEFWLNGVKVIDYTTPGGTTIETQGLGFLEGYQDAFSTPDAFTIRDVTIETAPGVDPTGDGIDFLFAPTEFATEFSAANVPLVAAGDWDIAETTAANPFEVASPINGGDVAFRIGGKLTDRENGFMFPVAITNNTGSDLVTVGSMGGSNTNGNAFGLQLTTQIAMHASPAGSEGDVSFSVAWFPFDELWLVGHLDEDFEPGLPRTRRSGAAVTNLPTPLEGDQDGIYDLTLGDYGPADGIMFVVCGRNEDNMASTVIDTADGWRVANRDNGSRPFNEETGTEKDDFVFAFMPAPPAALSGIEGPADAAFPLVDGRPTAPVAAELDADGMVAGQSWGQYTVSKEGPGLYRVTITGETPTTGMLLLSTNEAIAVEDPEDVLPGADSIPLNLYPTYQADGDDFLVQLVQLIDTSGEEPVVNQPTDGAFSFAFLPFDSAFTGDRPCSDFDVAAPFGTIDLADATSAFEGIEGPLALPRSDPNGDFIIDFFDYSFVQNGQQAGCGD